MWMLDNPRLPKEFERNTHTLEPTQQYLQRVGEHFGGAALGPCCSCS